jgi:hypothetical protein
MLCALTVAWISLAGVAGTQAHSRVVIRHGLFYRPHELPISGDGDFSVHHLRWQSWGGKTAVGYGQAVEEERPNHRDFFYPARVTASRRVYCAALHRTVYNKVLVTLLSPGTGVFGTRTAGFASTCRGFLHLIG